MAAVTCQTVLNKILHRLRDTNTISSTPITDTYQLLLLEFFNQFKQEVEDKCDWRALSQTFTVTIPSGSYSAAISGTNERTRVVRVPILAGGMSQSGYKPSLIGSDEVVALVFDTTASNNPMTLYEMPLNQLLYDVKNTNQQQVEQPQFFALGAANADAGTAGSNEQVLYVSPPVNNDRTVTITLCVPQSDFTTDLQDDGGSTSIYVPTQPIVAGLEWQAREEFGEELGESGAFTEERYRAILDSAAARENAVQGNIADLVLL